MALKSVMLVYLLLYGHCCNAWADAEDIASFVASAVPRLIGWTIVGGSLYGAGYGCYRLYRHIKPEDKKQGFEPENPSFENGTLWLILKEDPEKLEKLWKSALPDNYILVRRNNNK